MATQIAARDWVRKCSDQDVNKKSGVADALKQYERYCKAPDKLTKPAEHEKAKSAVDGLKKALTKAKRLIGTKGDKNAQKAVKDYEKELGSYEKLLGEAKAVLDEGLEKSAGIMAMLKRAKNEDLPFVFAHKGAEGELKLLKRPSELKSAIVDARKKLSGAKIYKGKCKVQGGSKLVLSFVGKKPPEVRKLLKKLLTEAGTSMKPVVKNPGEEEEEEEEAQP